MRFIKRNKEKVEVSLINNKEKVSKEAKLLTKIVEEGRTIDKYINAKNTRRYRLLFTVAALFQVSPTKKKNKQTKTSDNKSEVINKKR